jgi:hypothetical protein
MEHFNIKTQTNLENTNQNKHDNTIDNSISTDFQYIDYNKEKFNSYSMSKYKNDIILLGLKNTWDNICYYLINNTNTNTFFNTTDIAELYEIGLSLEDKTQKKANGQYHTPLDVANVMSNWFFNLEGFNICDVACGTGNLILSYFDLIGTDKAVKQIKEGRIYLYEIDSTALNICKTLLIIKFGTEIVKNIHFVECDFLNDNIKLPNNCKVISNPPYKTLDNIPPTWAETDIAITTKELYSIFMEKIISQSNSSVIITPCSFIGSSKFYELRKFMNNYGGFVVSFDNVPGNIFNGKKHGTFNTNNANSVRASITVVENIKNEKGFSFSPLIRFKNKERNLLLNNEILKNFVYEKKQFVSEKNPMYFKCDKRLGEIFETWVNKSKASIADYLQNDSILNISMPNTCRYFTVASKERMNRRGQITLSVKDQDFHNFLYCFLNSSFSYWYWRLYDGGITFTKSLLLQMPVFFDLLTADDKLFFENTATQMSNIANEYLVKKKNVGVQENIKYPKAYRDKINRRLLDIIGISVDEKIFDIIHSNTAMEVNL